MAIVSLFSLIHLPIDEQFPLINRLFDWLEPAGFLLLTVGSKAWTGNEDDWLGIEGVTMFWSHADFETYDLWLRESGFNLIWNRFVPEGNGGHRLILAQKPEL